MTIRTSGLDPLVPSDCRLLILGALPGKQSLKENCYYSHQRNRFWILMAEILKENLIVHPLLVRQKILNDRGIGLWDVVASAEREGSLDQAIRQPVLNEIPSAVTLLPQLRAVAINGGTAWRLARPWRDTLSVPVIPLPSTSPAHVRFSEADRQKWLELGHFLDQSTDQSIGLKL